MSLFLSVPACCLCLRSLSLNVPVNHLESQIFFWNTENCFTLFSRALNSHHTLVALTHTSHIDILHECFTRSAPEEVAFLPHPPSLHPLSLSISLCLHLPFLLLSSLCLICWGGTNLRLVPASLLCIFRFSPFSLCLTSVYALTV